MNKRRQRILKRAMDLAGASVGLAILSPVYAAISLAIIRDMGRPILFGHKRPGFRNRPFEMLKFRTMRNPQPGEDLYYSDQDRLTKLGAMLKRHSLDELPELWNVLRGEMSLVGPRPLLMEYLEHYTPEQIRRHDVKPGITGWAQVNGRTSITSSRKFELDVWYVDHWSLWLDVKILLLTVWQLFAPADTVVHQDHATIDDVGFLKARNENL